MLKFLDRQVTVVRVRPTYYLKHPITCDRLAAEHDGIFVGSKIRADVAGELAACLVGGAKASATGNSREASGTNHALLVTARPLVMESRPTKHVPIGCLLAPVCCTVQKLAAVGQGNLPSLRR